MSVAQTVRSGEGFLRSAAVSLYGWLYAVYCGLVVLDSVYAGLLRAEFETGVTDGIFSKISDFLVLPFGLLMLSGAAALGAALNRPSVLHLILVSWLLPMVLLGLYLVLADVLEASGFGTTIRLLAAAAGSILAAAAVIRFHRLESRPG